MNTVELVTVVAVGLAAVAGVSAAIYAYLPASLMQSAGRHGRYAGLAAPVGQVDPPGGQVRARGFSLGLRPQV